MKYLTKKQKERKEKELEELRKKRVDDIQYQEVDISKVAQSIESIVL